MARNGSNERSLIMDEIESEQGAGQDEQTAEQRRQKYYRAIAAYLNSFSDRKEKPPTFNQGLTADQKQKRLKKTRELENAFKNFFNEIGAGCLNLNRLAEDKELNDEVVAEIFEKVHLALIELMGEPENDINQSMEKHKYYLNPAYLIKSETSEIEGKPKVFSQQVISHVTDRVKKLKKECYTLLDQDAARRGRCMPHLAKVGRVAGVIVSTLLAAVLGAAMMFLLANYSDVIFAVENIVQTINSQLGLFIVPGVLAGAGGATASYYKFFKTGARSKTDRIADSIENLMKARLQYVVTASKLANNHKPADSTSNEKPFAEGEQGSLDNQKTGCFSFFLEWCGFKSDEQTETNIRSLYNQ